jgi:hypothetical protein
MRSPQNLFALLTQRVLIKFSTIKIGLVGWFIYKLSSPGPGPPMNYLNLDRLGTRGQMNKEIRDPICRCGEDASGFRACRVQAARLGAA